MQVSAARRSHRFMLDRRGGVAIVFALICGLLFISIGAAIDFSRAHNVATHTQRALDSAVLAGGRTLQLDNTDTAAAIEAATKVYAENVKTRMPITAEEVKFELSDNDTSFSGTATASVETTFLKAASFDSLSFGTLAKTQIAVGGDGGSNIEVALMLDVTGSMCADHSGPCKSDPKLASLKAAAKDLIDIVVSDNQSKKTSRVALVPFSTRVRVDTDGAGQAIMKTLTNLGPVWNGWYKMCVDSTGTDSSESGGTWTCNQFNTAQYANWKIMPCVTDRFYDDGQRMDYTDDLPGPNAWLNAHDGGRMPQSRDSADLPPTDQIGASAADPATHWNYNDEASGGVCADIMNSNVVMPLSADKTDLKKRVDDLEAYGSTAGALGTAWAWYMLSPTWANVWGGASKPGTYDDVMAEQANGAPKLRKIAVLMTDGVYNTYRGWKDQDQQEVSDHAAQLCTSMKAKGIEVFTVGFALDELPGEERTIAEATLKSCGNDISHFFNATDDAQLRQAFRSIALQLSSLYLSK